jgi:4-diphosphocytidyl-2-C-methyl-D-erythritol kinase
MRPVLYETAFAKINLALHVRRKRGDGYHELETIFAFADHGDRLTAEPADTLQLAIRGPFAEGLSTSDNLILRAAEILRSHYAISAGASITLDKRLPVASGIGGGSADAAAAARLLNRLWKIKAKDAELAQLLAPLGADIPACVSSRTALGSGLGTELHLLDGSDISGRPLLLVNPLKPVSTAAVFQAWDGVDRGALSDGGAWHAALSGRNDLLAAAVAVCPVIAEILVRLGKFEAASLVRMSGSGATCFAIFDSIDERDAAQAVIANACPAWWTMASSLR